MTPEHEHILNLIHERDKKWLCPHKRDWPKVESVVMTYFALTKAERRDDIEGFDGWDRDRNSYQVKMDRKSYGTANLYFEVGKLRFNDDGISYGNWKPKNLDVDFFVWVRIDGSAYKIPGAWLRENQNNPAFKKVHAEAKPGEGYTSEGRLIPIDVVPQYRLQIWTPPE